MSSRASREIPDTNEITHSTGVIFKEKKTIWGLLLRCCMGLTFLTDVILTVEQRRVTLSKGDYRFVTGMQVNQFSKISDDPSVGCIVRDSESRIHLNFRIFSVGSLLIASVLFLPSPVP